MKVSVKMYITVVMATYNGSKYIEEQIESIFKQTHKPDEVIFCDDGSNDNTIELISKFVADHGLKCWRIIRNNHLGITNNFYFGIQEAMGNIVFISDQDDIWQENKIEEMIKPFDDPNILTVTCRKELIDSCGNSLKGYSERILYPKIKKNSGRKLNVFEELKFLPSSGLCLAFRKDFFAEVQAFVKEYDLPYDLPFGVISSLKKGDYSINVNLVRHRIHTDNASAPISSVSGRIGKRKYQIESHKMRLKILQAVLNQYRNLLDRKQIEIIENAISIHTRFIEALSSANVLILLKMLLLSNNDVINKYMGFADILSVL